MTPLPDTTPRILWDTSGSRAEQDCACAIGDEAPVLLTALPGEHAEDDCACAEPISAVSLSRTYVPDSAAWQISPGLHRQPLPNAHELAFNPIGPAGVVVVNRPAQARLNAYRAPSPLTDDTARRLAVLHLLGPIGRPQPAILRQPSTLTAWLHLTNACNLRCGYCYLNKTDEAMTEDTGRAAVDAVFRSALANGFRAIKLKYAGGEATLNFPLAQTLHDYARRQSARTGLLLYAVMLSNGVALTPAMIDWMRDEQVRLMISLDGIGVAHDAQRVFINGRGSFDWVIRGIDRALQRGLTPHLSITVTARNADTLVDAVAFAIARDLPFNLNFFRDNECTATQVNWIADQTRLIAGMKAAFAVIEASLPRRRLIDALVDRSAFDGPHQLPCGAGHNYLVVDQRGRVARCQTEIERAVTDVMVADPLAVTRAHPIGFQNVPVDEKEGCRDCEWRYWCAGGCPLLTFRTTGRSDVKSPYCDVYRTLYPDVLRLEGLRLLKWQPAVA